MAQWKAKSEVTSCPLQKTQIFWSFVSRNSCRFLLWSIHRQTLIDSPLFHPPPPPQLPQQQVLPITAPAGKLFEKSVSLLPHCRSLGSVSGWPAQWKTLLAFTYDVNTRCRAPPPVMTVPPTGGIIYTWRGKTRAWAVPPHKVKLKVAITSFPSFEKQNHAVITGVEDTFPVAVLNCFHMEFWIYCELAALGRFGAARKVPELEFSK